MNNADAYNSVEEIVPPARVVRLKTLEEIARAKTPEESQLQAALNAVAQASQLMERMHQRCTDIERQAEEYVYSAREDVTKARQYIVQLEQTLRQAEDAAKSFQIQSKTQVLQLKELEVANRDLRERAEAAEAALQDRTNAVAMLQLAINDHLDSSLKRIDSMGESRLGFMPPRSAVA